MPLSNDPHYANPNLEAGKWGDIGGVSDVGPMIKLTGCQQYDAQLATIELVGYGKGESMKFLEILGIDKEMAPDDNCSHRRQGHKPSAPDHHRDRPTPG
jgi:hypothetical protein